MTLAIEDNEVTQVTQVMPKELEVGKSYDMAGIGVQSALQSTRWASFSEQVLYESRKAESGPMCNSGS